MKNNKSYIESLKNNFGTILLILTILGTFIGLFIVPYSFDDIGYYFKYAQEIFNKQNGLLYRDIEMNYTPLPIYLYSLLFNFYDGLPPNYAFLLINLVFIFGSLICVSGILSIFKIRRNTIFIALSIYLFSINAIGTSSTEHFVIFFELLMLYLLLTKNSSFALIGAGIAAFLAFFSKQYGIVSIFIGLLAFIYPTKRISKIPYFIIGLIIPNLLIFLFWHWYGNGYTIIDFYSKLLFPKGDKATLTGEGYNISAFFIGLTQFVLIAIYLVPAIYHYFKAKFYNNKNLNFIIIFGLVNMSPLLIASYFHYYLLILPFVVIFSAVVLSDLDYNNKYIKIAAFTTVIVCFLMWSIAFVRMKKMDGRWTPTRVLSIHPNALLEKECESLNKIIPRGSKVFIEANVFFYYPADFYSIDIKHLGYTWAQQQNSVNNVLKYLDHNEYLLTRKNTRFSEYPKFVEEVAMKDKQYEVFEWSTTFPYGKSEPIYIVHKK
ncbi:MAG: hypothetical protein PHV20_13110 [Bacteroidales bacterium]|nr:hypothetical protein [Bacteroidales bacterium]